MKLAALFVSILFISAGLAAQSQTQGPPQTQSQAPSKAPNQTPPRKGPPAPRVRQSSGPSRVIEEVVARVNNQIITTSDLEHSRQLMGEEVRQECTGCTPEALASALAEKEKNLLRDLIDQSLLSQRGKDLGISVETRVIQRLDEVRQQNNLETMEELEKAVESQGTSFEDFKNNIRDALLTQEVIRREVQSDIISEPAEVRKYYEAHKEEFKKPDQVFLREIFVSTAGKTEAELPDLEKKAKTLLDRVKKGEDFGELAKHYSDGQTAKQGGELGGFERGKLDPVIEAIVFKMNRNDLTEVTRTKDGFMVLQVEMRYEAGIQPMEKVQGEIMYRLNLEKTEPALRRYVKKLREESYVTVKPGYVDTAAVSTGATIEEVPATPDNPKSDKANKPGAKGKKGKSGAFLPPRGGNAAP